MAEYGSYEKMDPREQDIVDKVISLFEQLNMWRVNFASQWEEVAELIMPNQRNTFYRWNVNFPGMKKTDRQVDATGMLALQRFGAIVDSLLTPRNMTWHTLAADNPDVQKDRQVQLWFEEATRRLFKLRYAPIANFVGQNQQVYQSIGAFGNGGIFIDQAVGYQGEQLRAIRYKALPIGELFIRENHQGLVDGFVRAFRLSARQAIARWGDKCPQVLHDAAQKQSEQLYDFFHAVIPNDGFDPLSMHYRSMRFASYYVSMEGRCLLQEGGYKSFPLSFSRYDQGPWEVYGRGPAMAVLPSLKTLNAEKRTFLKAGHRAADPVLLTHDDGLVGFSLRPGALNKGGMNADGRPLVGVLPSGNIQITKEMMDEEVALIKDSFLVSLFQILEETPQMTATEVIERINEKGILIAPTVGRQQSEYLGPLIDRELDLMVELRLLPPMPPVLKESKGEYNVVYTSPLSKAQRAQEAAGFIRTVESTIQIVNATQDASILDSFAFERAVPAIADIQGVPPSWMASDDEKANKAKGRQQAMAAQQQIQAAPAAAAMLKAHVAAAKEGVQVPGQEGQQQGGQ